jgi:gamma-glutamyltranspeptidase
MVYMHRQQAVSSPACRKTFTKPGTGELLQAEDIMKNPKLGKTLRVIAMQGADSLYNGTLAKALVDDVKSSGGLLDTKDLATYK